jgi:hypothetical protein
MTATDVVGDSCAGVGIEKHDANVFANGGGWNATVTDGRLVEKFLPAQYPWKYTKFCIALCQNTLPDSLHFSIVMYADNGGTPATTELWTLPNQHATGIPAWTNFAWYSFDISSSPVVSSGFVYIGIKWDPSVAGAAGKYCMIDQNTFTPTWPCWAWANTGPWTSAATYWAGLQSWGMRTQGGVPGPTITHTPLPNTQNTTGPYIVNATIAPAGSGINPFWTKILWSRNNPVFTDSVQMTNSSGISWTGNIPGNGTNATYRYYIRTADSLGRVSTYPMQAPTNFCMFTASSTDTSKPVIVHTPIGNTPKVQWPATVNCSVTEPFGIDSVWVRWYKNTGAYTRFNLAHGTGNNWSAPFNSDTSQVTPGDHIYYRVIGRSASAQHTMDSTALLTFDIINQVTACVGTGTVSSNFPFTTYWEDGRTDMLYLSSEIVAAGGGTGLISQIGFNVITMGGPAMNGFFIKAQWTTATSLTAFTNTGWNVFYNGTYTVAGTGWQYITLQNPIPFQVGQNLLLEVCYNNAAWTAYSPVYATTTAGNQMAAYSTDLPTDDGCTTGWTAGTYNYRPNTCFVMGLGVLGVGNTHNVIPGEYKLSQNYPNPFNPTTKIDYAIKKNGFVSLKIFDVLGREVKQLVNETKNAGYYSVDFNGAEFSSGVYFYKLESNGFTDVKRMMLIK